MVVLRRSVLLIASSLLCLVAFFGGWAQAALEPYEPPTRPSDFLYSAPTWPATEPTYAGEWKEFRTCSAEPSGTQFETDIKLGLLALCKTLYDSTKELGKRLVWISQEGAKQYARSGEITTKIATTNTKLEAIESKLTAIEIALGSKGAIAEGLSQLHKDLTVSGGFKTTVSGFTSLNPLPVHETLQSLPAELVSESVNASGESLRGGLYFLAGCLVAALVGYVIYRQVMPRA